MFYISFLKFMHNCLTVGIPIYIATRGPVSNAIDIVNRAYHQWCIEAKKIEYQNVNYSYDGKKNILNKSDLIIKKNDFIGMETPILMKSTPKISS